MKTEEKPKAERKRKQRKQSHRDMAQVIMDNCRRLRPMLEPMIVTMTKELTNNGKCVVKRKFVTKKFDAFKRGYFLVGKDEKVDAKTLEKENDMLVKELELTLDTIRAGLGNTIIRIRSAMDFGLTATVTSGVVNTVTCGTQTNGNIRFEDVHDWASLSLMFDEVKCLGGETVFIYNNLSKAIGTAVDANSVPVITWQPTAAVLSGVVSATQIAQKKFLPIAPTATTTPQVHKFTWKVPPGDGVVPATTAVIGVSDWVLVVDATTDNVSCGSVGFIHVGTVTTATKIGAGVLIMDCEFRIRA
jgi:hypothetical protein